MYKNLILHSKLAEVDAFVQMRFPPVLVSQQRPPNFQNFDVDNKKLIFEDQLFAGRSELRDPGGVQANTRLTQVCERRHATYLADS